MNLHREETGVHSPEIGLIRDLLTLHYFNLDPFLPRRLVQDAPRREQNGKATPRSNILGEV